MSLIGIDIGSSFIKGGVLDLDDLQIRHIVRQPFPEPIAGLASGWFEVEPRAVIAAVETVLFRLLDAAPDCGGLLFCGQMGGVLLTDEHGEPLTNYLSWRDQRSTMPLDSSDRSRTIYDSIAEQLGPEELCAVGNELKPGSLTTLLACLSRAGKLPSGAVPLNIGDFVVSRLCRASPRFEVTQAIGLLDLATLSWRHEAFEKLGLHDLNCPELARFHEAVGTVSFRGRDISCYPVVGDQQAALAGALLAAGELSLNISTGSQVSQLTDVAIAGDYQSRPFFDSGWLNTITHLPAGRSLEVLVDFVAELPRRAGTPLADPWPLISQAAETASDSDLDVALTFFAGPLGDRGHVRNISVDNLTVGSLFRNAFRHMADNYSRCAERLNPQRNWSRVVFSGGLAQKLPLLRDFVVSRLGGTYRQCPSSEDALFGLLVLGHVTSGRAKSVAQASSHVGARCMRMSLAGGIP